MKKHPISREFFPWNLFAPPIREKFPVKAATILATMEKRMI